MRSKGLHWRIAIGSTAIVFSLLASENANLAQTADVNPLRLDPKIPLGKVVGRIDHMAIDLARHRLFVAELGNNSVGIVDIDAKAVVHRISGLSEPQGVAYVQATDTLYVTNGGDGSVRIFQGSDYAQIGQIPLHADADNIRFDAMRQRLLVGYGSGALAVIDPATRLTVTTYALKAHPESFQIDRKSNRIFVNLPQVRAIAALDRMTGKELARWPMRYAAQYAMTLDQVQPRLFVVFRRPAKLVTVSTETGKALAEVDTCGDSDDLFLDAERHRVYVVCGDGNIDVFDAGDISRRLMHIPTSEGARTGLFVPNMDRLFVAARAQRRDPASIWVFKTAP